VSNANARARKDGSDLETAECLFLTRGRLGYTCHIRSESNDIKKENTKYYQKPSPPQLDPQSRNAPSPAPQPQLAQTDQIRPPASETLTPRRDVFDFTRSADSAPAKTDQIRPPPPSLAKPNPHGEALLTPLGQQTQRPQYGSDSPPHHH
jgi:hypothetical protein